MHMLQDSAFSLMLAATVQAPHSNTMVNWRYAPLPFQSIKPMCAYWYEKSKKKIVDTYVESLASVVSTMGLAYFHTALFHSLGLKNQRNIGKGMCIYILNQYVSLAM